MKNVHIILVFLFSQENQKLTRRDVVKLAKQFVSTLRSYLSFTHVSICRGRENWHEQRASSGRPAFSGRDLTTRAGHDLWPLIRTDKRKEVGNNQDVSVRFCLVTSLLRCPWKNRNSDFDISWEKKNVRVGVEWRKLNITLLEILVFQIKKGLRFISWFFLSNMVDNSSCLICQY